MAKIQAYKDILFLRHFQENEINPPHTLPAIYLSSVGPLGATTALQIGLPRLPRAKLLRIDAQCSSKGVKHNAIIASTLQSNRETDSFQEHAVQLKQFLPALIRAIGRQCSSRSARHNSNNHQLRLQSNRATMLLKKHAAQLKQS